VQRLEREAAERRHKLEAQQEANSLERLQKIKQLKQQTAER